MANAFFDAMPKELRAKMWLSYNWKDAQKELLELQQELAKAVYNENENEIIRLQKEIVRSDFAKMLAVKKVCSGNGNVGIDKVKWKTPEEKYSAAMSLTSKDYHSKPYRHIIIESKSGKKRHINLPTYYDKAMQVLYSFSLNPVAEATGERKSFAFRQGRSMQDVNEYIKEALKPKAVRYVIIADVKACYHSISHEWLLNNIPMDKRVLKEFLTAGYVFDGELFPTDDYGISLGCNISPILGNMTLDGMQKYVYHYMYGDTEPIYENGNLIRFADDILITVSSEEDAEIIIKGLSDFLFERGLRLSEEKTRVVNIEEGFDFLSRNYIKKNGIVCVTPSEYAVTRFENELEELILNYKGSQKSLIDKLNCKIRGWVTYHKVSDALFTFRRVDVFIKATLMKLCQLKHPTWSINKIRDKYWYCDYNGEYVYALKDRVDVRVIKLSETLIVEHRKVKTNANAYLDIDYIESRTENSEIENVTGKYRAIWNRQGGRCLYCGKKILADHSKEIIQRNLGKGYGINNLGYIHRQCRNSPVEYAFTDSTPICENDIISLINSLDKKKNKKGLKFSQLDSFFQKCIQPTISLTFKEIEEIIGEPLCNSAYTRRQYWYSTKENCISKSWLMNGYSLKRLHLERKRITFCKTDRIGVPLDIPEVFLNGRVPKDAKCELENYFGYIQKKYGL